MILAIDAGNTHIAFGSVKGTNEAELILRIATDERETAVGYAAKIKQAFELFGISVASFQGAILSSVVPSITNELSDAIFLLIGKKPLVVGSGIKTGLHIAIDDPGTIASDLVALAVAAKEEYPLPCVVIYMGTATTMMVVNENGKFIGGAILPGVEISLNALTEEASLLPGVQIGLPKKAIGSSTIESMKSGIVYGAAGAIDGVLDKFSKELGREPASIVATGKFGKLILSNCRHKICEDERLLLKGLGIIYRKNLK